MRLLCAFVLVLALTMVAEGAAACAGCTLTNEMSMSHAGLDVSLPVSLTAPYGSEASASLDFRQSELRAARAVVKLITRLKRLGVSGAVTIKAEDLPGYVGNGTSGEHPTATISYCRPAGVGAARCDHAVHALDRGHAALDAERLCELAFIDVARHSGASVLAITKARRSPSTLYLVHVGYFRSATRAANHLDAVVARVARARAEAKDEWRRLALLNAWRPSPITVRYGVEAADDASPFPHVDSWYSATRAAYGVVAGMHIDANAAMAQAMALKAAGVSVSIAVHPL